MNKNQIMGGLLGVLIGDALGLPVQFAPREERKKKPVVSMEGWGTFNMPPGSFSDDGSLTLCLAESICEAGLNAEDAAGRFLRWYTEGYWTPKGFAYDIGGSTRRAMERLKKGVPAIDAGPKGENDNGNGSLMRIMPAVLYLAGAGIEDLANGIWKISRITHGHPRACSACYIYALLAKELLTGVHPDEAYQNLCSLPEEVLQAGIDDAEIKHFARILGGQLKQVSEREIRSSGYVVHTLEAAIWCLLNNNDFVSTLLAAVNLGEDTDTVAAVTGGLAGISYRFEAIPAEWLEDLVRRDEIFSLANGFVNKLMQIRNVESGDNDIKEIGENSKKDQEAPKKSACATQAGKTDSSTGSIKGNQTLQNLVDNPEIKILEQVLSYRDLFEQGETALFDLDATTGKMNPYSYSQEFMAFIQTLYDSQFLIVYDWMNRGIWGERYFNDLDRLAKADLLILRLLLSAAARNDRFCDDYLGSLGREGQLRAMMQRVEEIYNELKNGRRQWQRVNCGPLPDRKIDFLYRYDNFDRMYWVDPGRLLAGCYPGDLKLEKATEKLMFLVKSGIRQVVNLMEENETNHSEQAFIPYEEELQKLARKNGSDIKTCRLKIKDMSVSTKAEMKDILDAIDLALEEDRPVYLHCWGGHGRTGMVAGCYLVRHDLVSPRKVLTYLNDIRRDIVDGNKPSPQTQEQCSMVRNWKVGF